MLSVTLLPVQAFAFFEYVDDAQHITFDTSAKASQAGDYYYLENDYLSFRINASDGFEMLTIPVQHKGKEAEYIDSCTKQELSLFYYGYNRGVRTTKTIINPIAKITTSNDAIKVEYTFPSYSSNYKYTITYRLAQQPDSINHKNNYGVHATTTYVGDFPSQDGLVDGGVALSINYYNFPSMGHVDTDASGVSTQMTVRDYEGNTTNSTITNGLGLTETDGKNTSIAEVVCNNYSWAKPFVATSDFDGARSIDPGFQGEYRYPNEIKYGDFKYNTFPFLHSTFHFGSKTVKLLTAYSYIPDGHAFWGYRDLVDSTSGQSTPPETVTPSENDDRLGIYKSGSGYAAYPAKDEAEIKRLSEQYGNPVAVFHGAFSTVNGNYVFTSGSAKLSSTVSATWNATSGAFSVSPNGTISQNGVNLSAPSFKFYQPKSGREGDLKLEFAAGGLSAKINPSYNGAIISADIPYASVQVQGVSAAYNGDLTLTGELSIATVFNGAEFSMEKLGYGLKSNGTFSVNGVKAQGQFDTNSLFGMKLAKVKGEINTFAGEESYDFSLELDVFDLFEAEAELTLKRHTKSGTIMPNKVYAYIGAEPGVPLVPPVVVARLVGGGVGFDGLADTVNGDFFAVPPITLRGTAGVNVLHFVEGKGDITIGPGTYRKSIKDVKLAGVDFSVISEFTKYATLQGKTVSHWGTDFQGLQLSAGMYLEASFPSKEKDWIVLYGGLGFGAFAGFNGDYSAAYLVIGGNGKIGGKLQFPSGWAIVGGKTIVSADIEGAVGVQTVIYLDKSWENTLSSIYKNADIYFGLVGNASVLGTKVRVWYIHPPNDRSTHGYTIKTPGFRMPDWNWGDHGIPTFLSTTATVEDEQGEQVGMMGIDASLPDFSSGEAGDVIVSPLGASPQTVTFAAIDSDVDEPLYMLIQPDKKMTEEDFEAFRKSLVITNDTTSTPLPLVWAEDLPDEVTTEQLEKTNAVTGSNSEDGSPGIMVHVGNGGVDQSFTVEANAGFTVKTDNGEAPTVFEATFDGSTISGTIKRAGAQKTYAMNTYLGIEQGDRDYLIDSSNVTDPAAITCTVPTTGGEVPTGTYYVTSCMMEVVSDDFDGNTILDESEIAYLSLNDVEFATTINYTNTLQPTAPSDVSISARGNETMNVTWKEVTGASGYMLSIYEVNGASSSDTGVSYQFDVNDIDGLSGITYNNGFYGLDMALTGGGLDESGSPAVLEAGKTYQIGAQAYKDISADEKVNAPVYSSMAYSNVEFLPAYIELDPEIILNVNALAADPATGIYDATINGSNNWFEVKDGQNPNATYTITRTDDNSQLLKEYGLFYLPSDFEGSLLLEVTGSIEHDGVTDITERFILVQHDSVVPVIELDSEVFYADRVTGRYAITGLTEPGALVTSDDVVDSETGLFGSVVANSDGTFVMEGNLKEAFEDENGETGFLSKPLTLFATDSVGNKSIPATAFATTQALVTAISIVSEDGRNTITTKGGTLQLFTIVEPSTALNKTVAWSIVSGNAFASVDQNGLVTAIGNGVVVVRATAQDGSGVYGEFTITITGQDAPSPEGQGPTSPSGLKRTGDELPLAVFVVLGSAALIGLAYLVHRGRRKMTRANPRDQ